MKKGLKTLIAGIVLLFAGVFVVPVLWILPVITQETKQQQFLGPGAIDYQAAESGRYYLMNDFQSFYDGRNYHRPEDLPDGLEVVVTDGAGERVAFFADRSFSSTSGGRSSRSVGYVDLDGPEQLTVVVDGRFEPRVFSFGKSRFMEVFKLIFGVFGVSALIVVVGLGLAIWGLVKLLNAPKEEPVSGANVPPPIP
ncbi:hypothetical protein [Sulfuriroseicoccus oceanibius]|uniref:Uncharacterized protein n=1 Tax=Sulfuriroseicoccus oceanibius TaxID=2707525 RepID=A0A6B3LC89_9BACT|nr:hypothetical protein [Sulfuriroseicoccus oceanibius]QQL44580.1 hypothetical protein G3M56_011915 [Sulfuriroseicoccus oceanibius]